jgi:hypothetical protein
MTTQLQQAFEIIFLQSQNLLPLFSNAYGTCLMLLGVKKCLRGVVLARILFFVLILLSAAKA